MMAERRVPHRDRTSSSGISGTAHPVSESVDSDPNPLVVEGDLEKGEPVRTTLDRFLGKGRKKVGVIESIKNIYGCSCAFVFSRRKIYILIFTLLTGLNVLLLLTPVAWWAHFDRRLDDSLIFARKFCRIKVREQS